ncbi:glutathione S-transferase family protein [Sphingopyxis sp.]|jgi:glutathione S-transferase|uniref:glutathione S-transferase family protein n=1 Tax=Sphingopyxis sp. TaxID=1908224 RepID=UPI003F71BF9A
MLTLYDYLPSQNAWKIRQILRHTGIAYRTELVSIFAGEGQSAAYLEINPWGAVPAVRFAGGRVLSESNAILWHLARGTAYLPDDPFDQSKVMQWLSFEADYVQTSIGSLRYWNLTGKLARRDASLIASKRSVAARALDILDRAFAARPFIAGHRYTIADIALFAYAHKAEEAGLTLDGLANFRAWVERVRGQDGFLSEMHPYAIDPLASAELP